MNDQDYFDVLSHSPDRNAGNKPDLRIYGSGGSFIRNKVSVQMPFSGLVRNTNGSLNETNVFEIAYTQHGTKGPIVLMLHGVPTNRDQYIELQRLLGPFCRTVAIDMLGMGESSKPLNYGKNQVLANRDLRGDVVNPHNPWDWRYDVLYIDQVMDQLYPGEKFVFIADDWGSGINSHYAANRNQRLLAFIQIDPIAFDGYPVNEIQAIGRASQIESDQQFMQAMGDIDSKIIQIEKTMVHNRDKVFNQYVYRMLLRPYVDVDYQRKDVPGVTLGANSVNMHLHQDALRTLADRAAILAPNLLQPFHNTKNPRGVKFNQITVPSLILWGEHDNMMPNNQLYRFFWVLDRSRVQITKIPDAGHFAGLDQPERIGEEILNFLNRELGRLTLATPFLGFTGIWKGDEAEVHRGLVKVLTGQ